MAEQEKSDKGSKRRKKNSSIADAARQFSRFEVLFIVVLFLSFFAWAFAKCSQGYTLSTPTSGDVATQTDEDTDANLSPAAGTSPDSPGYDMGQAEQMDGSTSGGTAVVGRQEASSGLPARRSYTPLYVTLQDLKVRRGPNRDSTIVAVLDLHEEVMFMEKRTDFSEKINIGVETTDEPWIYIQTRKGHKGWVYGAGVNFFKWDRLNDPIRSLDDAAPQEE